MNHYVYKITEKNTREFYYGSRSCKCKPINDNYMGSYTTWCPQLSNLEKEIIKDGFKNRSKAITYEANLIRKEIDDPLNRNYHIPPDKFHTVGTTPVKDKNGNYFRVLKDDERLKNGELTIFWKGREHSKESKKKMSESALNRDISPEMEKLRRNKISNTMKGKKKSKTAIKNISEAKKGKKNPSYGKVWIFNPDLNKSKLINKNKNIPNGWRRGRK